MTRFFRSSLALSLLVSACGGEAAPAPLSPYTSEGDKTVVVGDGKGGTAYVTPDGSGCIQIGDQCVKPQDKCGKGERADVIVDSTGKVIEIICFPAASDPPRIDGNGNVELGKENKGVVSIDGLDDGVDVVGDVTSSGNKVTVYGQGPGVSIIGGSVTASGNNFAMRGVRVKGNVTVTGNDATLVLCIVDGDVMIYGNNAVIAECTVHGKIVIAGNNSKLVSNRVGRGVTIEGGNAYCDGNLAFNDANADKIVDAAELGAAIACTTKK